MRGKPRVHQPQLEPRPLEINLSHSGELALFAFALGRAVGIDVEVIKPRFDVSKLADSVLTEREREPLAGLDDNALLRAFLRCWTRKEAWIKASGDGLSKELQTFQVLPSAPEQAETPTCDNWWLVDLSPGTDAVGCLAVEGGAAAMQTRWLERSERV